MKFYHQPTNQPVDGQVVQAMTGIDPETACLEVLASVGVFPVVDKMESGLFDNPEPQYIVENGQAIKTNSNEPISIEIAKIKLENLLKTQLNAEVARVIDNSLLSLGSVILLQLEGGPDALTETQPLLKELIPFAKQMSELLGKVKNAKSTDEVKLLYQESLSRDS